MSLEISKPITLPSGLVLPNRLVKAAMAEAMSGPKTDYLPSDAMNRSYTAWADAGWGMILTGNVQVDTKYLGQPTDTSIIDNEAKQLESWRAWAKTIKGPTGSTPAVVQLNHPGRQSPVGAGTKGFFTKNVAPSPVPLDLGSNLLAKLASALVMGTPREMSVADIEEVVAQFARAAKLSADAGFDGVELHAAHGYLLAQFLSPKSNLRTDAYGGSPQKSAKIVADIVRAARAATPEGFTIGIKLNSVDHQSESALADCIEQLRVITEAGIDFLEVSGGTYEDPVVSAIQDPLFLVDGVSMKVSELAQSLLGSKIWQTVRSDSKNIDDERRQRFRRKVRQDQSSRGLLPRVRKGHPPQVSNPPTHRHWRLPHTPGYGGRGGRGRLRHGWHRPARHCQSEFAKQHNLQ